MKTIALKIWNWKYRNHALCFLIGVMLSSIFWLSGDIYENESLKKELIQERQTTKRMMNQLKSVPTLKKRADSLTNAIQKLQQKQLIERKKIYDDGNKKINAVDNSTARERQKFITDWAEKNGNNINLAE
jgi:hypothetical protein